MKKKVMIILLFILCIFSSSCSIFKDYVIDGYDKILTEKGYSIQTDINEINNKVESYIYKWNIISENEIISPRGSYIKKEDDSIFIRTPSLIDITIKEDENNIMMLEEDGIKYYVSKDLSVYSTLDRARVDILKVYKYEDYYILVVDNKYVYAVSDDLKRAFVNEDLSRTFLYGEDRVALDCANLYENVSKTSYYYINIVNSIKST